MADNVPITAGSGTNVATDDVGSVHFQKIKRNYGGSGVDADGLSKYREPALSNSDLTVKASAGFVHGYHFYNSNVTVAYVHLYDNVIASITVGTTVPDLTFAVVPGGGVDMIFPVPILFSTGIAIAATTTPTGGTAPTTALLANVLYV